MIGSKVVRNLLSLLDVLASGGESVDYPNIQKVETTNSWILGLQIDAFSIKSSVTLLLQDQWASLSIPADPDRFFDPV